MSPFSKVTLIPLGILTLTLASAGPTWSTSVGVFMGPDSVQTDNSTAVSTLPFYFYQPIEHARANRDVDFLWSYTYEYHGMPLSEYSADLEKLAEHFCVDTSNIYGLPWSQIQTVYNFFNKTDSL